MVEFEKIKLNDINPSEYNPRLMDETEFQKLSNSIREFGLVDPIIINLKNMKIIGGHQRYDVLQSENSKSGKYNDLVLLRRGDIGWVFTDLNLKLKDEAHEKGLNIALNKISGEWDYPKLNILLEELFEDANFDISLTGFESLDLNNFDDGLEDLDLGFDSLGTDDPSFIKATLIVDDEDPEKIEQLYDRLTEEGYDCRIK